LGTKKVISIILGKK